MEVGGSRMTQEAVLLALIADLYGQVATLQAHLEATQRGTNAANSPE